MHRRWPTLSRTSRQHSPSSRESESGSTPGTPSTPPASTPEPKNKPNRRGFRVCHKKDLSATDPTSPVSSEPLNPTEQLLRSLGLNEPGLSRIFADAAQYDRVVRDEQPGTEGQDELPRSEPGSDDSVQTKLHGFTRLVGKDLPQSERQASVRIAQLTVNNYSTTALDEGEGDFFDEDEESGSSTEGDSSARTSVTSVSDGSPAVEHAKEGEDAAGTSEKLEPAQIVDLLEQEFGALAEPGEEKLIAEADAALVQDVTILVRLLYRCLRYMG